MIHGLGAERTFVPMALWVDLCGGATGKVETTQERGGPGPGRHSRLLQITRLTSSGYLIRVWPFGLYALTIYAGVVMGIPAWWYQPKPSWRQRLSGARRIGP